VSKRELTARKLRALCPHVHVVRELLRDLAQEVARHFDARVEGSLGSLTAEQAHEIAVLEIVRTANEGLGPEASADELRRRWTTLYAGGLPLVDDATLFAADAIKGFGGTAMVQAGVVALSGLEVLLLGSRGRVLTHHGPPRLLDVESALGRRLVAFFRARTEKPLWGQTAVLLIVACPSRTLVGWRNAALDTAVAAIPVHQRHTRRRWLVNDLPPRARATYGRALGERLRGALGLVK
jgi:hypothetical protein